jgi:hypothetical protein
MNCSGKIDPGAFMRGDFIPERLKSLLNDKSREIPCLVHLTKMSKHGGTLHLSVRLGQYAICLEKALLCPYTQWSRSRLHLSPPKVNGFKQTTMDNVGHINHKNCFCLSPLLSIAKVPPQNVNCDDSGGEKCFHGYPLLFTRYYDNILVLISSSNFFKL